MAEGTPPKGSKLSKDVWKDLDQNVGNALNEAFKQISALRGRVARQNEDLGDIGDIGTDGGFFNTLNQNANQINKIQDALNDLNKKGLSFVRDPSFQKGMKNVTESLDIMLGSAERGAKTYASLFSQLKGFAQMSSIAFSDPTKGPQRINKQTRDLSDSLAEQGAILKSLGVDLSDFSANVDSAVYSFGLNKQEVLDFNLQLKDLSSNLQMMPSEVSRNFQLVSKNLAYDLGTIKDEFVKIQRLSLGTGVDTQTLIGSFGKRMDTIQGSSGAAASLNQILGDQVFSGNQLLRMTESERAEKIRAAFMNNDALMSDINAGGIASKFALQSASEALPGMDEDQVRRFILTGKKGESVKSLVAGKAADQTTKAEQEKFKSKIDNYSDAIAQATTQVLANVSDLRRAQILSRADYRKEEIQTGQPGLITQLGVTAMLGPMPGQVDRKLAARAFQAGGGEDLKRVIQFAQQGVISDKELQDIMNGLVDETDGGKNQRAARDKMRELTIGLKGQLNTKKIKDRLNLLPAPVKGAIDGIRKMSPFTARQIIKELGPGGLLEGTGRENTELFKQLKEVGDKMQSSGASVKTIAAGDEDEEFGILKGLKEVQAGRTAMQSRSAGSQEVTKYLGSLKNRGINEIDTKDDGASRFKPREQKTLNEVQIPKRRRDVRPQGLPNEFDDDQASTLGKRKGDITAVVQLVNSGPAIDPKRLSARVRFLEKNDARVREALDFPA